jgi:hypothetical protein
VVLGGKACENLLTGGRKANPDLAAVFFATNPLHESADGQAINQADGAMVVDQKMVRQIAYGRAAVLVQGPDRQEHLVLLGFKALSACSCLAEVQKAPDLVTERGQSLIVRE